MTATLEKNSLQTPPSSSLKIFKEINQGWRESILSLQLYLRSKNNRENAIMLLVMSFFMVGAIYGTMQIGNLLEMFVQYGRSYSGSSNTGLTFATSYVRDITNQDTGYLGAAIFAGAILSAVLAPFTGTTSLTFISKKESAGLLNSRMKPYSDSVLSSLLSVISPLQVLSLTLVTSLILIAGGDPLIAFPATWLLSLTIINVNILFIWVERAVSIRKSSRYSKIIAAVLIFSLGLAIILDPQHGRTAFGLSEIFFSAMLNSSSATFSDIVFFVGVIAIINIAIGLLTIKLSSSTVNSPAFTNRVGKKRVNIVTLDSVPKEYPYNGKGSHTFRLVNSMLSPFKYYPTYRLPFIVLVVLGAIVTFAMQGNNSVLAGVTLIIPFIVALGWSANILGILGGGLSWVLSFPTTKRRIVYLTFVTHVGISLMLTTMLVLPALISGLLTTEKIFSVLTTSIAGSAIIGAFAVTKSFTSPHPASLGSGGETVLPPTTTLVYTIQVIMLAMLPGIIVYFSGSMPYIQWSLAATIALISFMFVMRIQRKWLTDPNLIKMTINKVTQD